jgi:serine/threonine protein kinase
MASEEFAKGTLIGGRYDIRERLGQGGMGTVYRAFDTKVGQMVALKMIAGGGSEKSREDRLKRFGREILAINQVRHPNVLHVQEYGFHRDTPYMVMEFLDGSDLGEVLRKSKGPLAVDHAADIMLVVCAAIRSCHDAQVIHRDLKPGNIMIVKRDVGAGWDVKVVDFGISKSAGASDLTQEGKIIGTPHFLAPEQITGQVSVASDQYALGLLLYLCLTGRHPYGELEGLPLVRAIEKGVFPPPREYRPGIPEILERVILKAMHLNPAERYQSVFELGQQLRDFASPLGQQLWKRYYETPPVARAKDDSHMSSIGISLVQRIAEGAAAPSSATAQAHYQSTTAVAGAAEETLLEDRASIRLESGAGGTEVSLHTPHDWQWEKDSSKGTGASSPTSSGSAASSKTGARPRSRTRAIVLAAAVVVIAVASIGVARVSSNRTGAATPSRVDELSSLPLAAAPSAAGSAAPVPVAAPVARGNSPVARDPAPLITPKVERAEASPGPEAKHHHRAHVGSGAPKTSEWIKDSAGNLIPPP